MSIRHIENDGLGRPLGWSHFDDSLSSRPLLIGFEHGYDAAGNKLFQKSLHDDPDSQRYAYDSSDRLTAFVRGAFDGLTTPGSPAYCDPPSTATWPGLDAAQAWWLDGSGNWMNWRTWADGALDRDQSRAHTVFNEIARIASAGGTTVTLAHDANGNLTLGRCGGLTV